MHSIPKNIAVVVIAALASASAFGQSKGPAEALFSRYQSLEKSFDPRAADLYCDSALIRNVRTYPGGQQRTLELPAPKYKELIRAAMPLAKAKGDSSTYSQVTYTPEGSGVRINATRYSLLKQYSSPISLLVGSCDGGSWAILEELSQSQP